MLKQKFSWMLLVVLLAASLSSCSQNAYKQTSNGLQYKFIRQLDKDAAKPQPSDILTVKMSYFINDSLLFNSDQMGKPMQFPLMEPQFKGDFYEGLAMMAAGDSASFLCPADSVFLKIFRVKSMPDFVKENAVMRFEIGLEKIQTEADYQNEKMAAMQAQIDESNQKLAAYITEKNIQVEPTESGLYVVVTKKGNGEMPKKGQKVKVHYTGTLLNGVKFDSSHDRNQPIEFVLGMGQVIQGWDQGIGMIEEGGTATLIIPQHLAYRDRAAGIIPPFSPLVFDVELVEILK